MDSSKGDKDKLRIVKPIEKEEEGLLLRTGEQPTLLCLQSKVIKLNNIFDFFLLI